MGSEKFTQGGMQPHVPAGHRRRRHESVRFIASPSLRLYAVPVLRQQHRRRQVLQVRVRVPEERAIQAAA